MKKIIRFDILENWKYQPAQIIIKKEPISKMDIGFLYLQLSESITAEEAENLTSLLNKYVLNIGHSNLHPSESVAEFLQKPEILKILNL